MKDLVKNIQKYIKNRGTAFNDVELCEFEFLEDFICNYDILKIIEEMKRNKSGNLIFINSVALSCDTKGSNIRRGSG